MRTRLLCAAFCGALALQATPALAAVNSGREPETYPRLIQRLGAPASLRAADFQRCDAGPRTLCGTVDVPLDRRHPAHGTVPIYFVFDPPREGPWNEAILVTEGGPGLSVTQDGFLPDFYRGLFDPLMDTRGLLLLDQRGVGLSDVIDCPELQSPDRHLYQAVAACGKQLGFASPLYGSGDVALDIEAVRHSLGIKELNLYGGSYAGMDIQAYASRFPSRVRSAVLDSPVSAVDFDPLSRFAARGVPRIVNLLCDRSRSCSVEAGTAAGDLAWLLARLRSNPVEGVGHDAEGNEHNVRVTEGFLAWHVLLNDGGGFITGTEISAAARALRAGDAAPLLRLAAENAGPILAAESPDDPTLFSEGESFARYCTDGNFPWDENAPLPSRLRQFSATLASLDPGTFSPFSVGGWLAPAPDGLLGPDPCITWPAPKRNVPRPIPPGARLPGDVPAFVITGDLDVGLPTQQSLTIAKAWPHSRFVEIVDSGHHTATNVRFECSGEMIVSFIAHLHPGDTRCANHHVISFPGVGRFPVHAKDAREAKVDPGNGDASTAADRRVATVATAAVTDSFRRAFTGFIMGGAGLRGGTFDLEFLDDRAVSTLHGARFAQDVAVSGSGEYSFETEELDASVTVNGPGSEDGTLHVTGVWFGFAHPTTVLRVRGTLGGRHVALRVPAS